MVCRLKCKSAVNEQIPVAQNHVLLEAKETVILDAQWDHMAQERHHSLDYNNKKDI